MNVDWSKCRPLRGQVIVRRLKSKNTTEGGIILVGHSGGFTQIGVVVAVGKRKWPKTGIPRWSGVKPGDNVIFNKYKGRDVLYGDPEYVTLMPEDIDGVLEVEVSKKDLNDIVEKILVKMKAELDYLCKH